MVSTTFFLTTLGGILANGNLNILELIPKY